MVTMATQMPHVVAPLRNEIVSHFAKVVFGADDNSQESKDLVVCMYVCMYLALFLWCLYYGVFTVNGP